jgi:glycosyltransferase
MKISIITVCYNSVTTISDALESVANQTWPEVEHIVIDGSSSDGTQAIIDRYRLGLACIISEPDAGIYDAMNKGLRLATGDWVGFLNSDDILASPDILSLVASVAKKNPQADAIYGNLQYVAKENPQQRLRYWRSDAFVPSKLRWGWMPPHPTLFVRRSVMQELKGFNTAFRISGDYDFVLRLFKRPGRHYAHIPKVLVLMRAGGVSNGSLSAWLCKIFEDYRALRHNQLGGVLALFCKRFRKLGQLFA